MVQSRYIHIVKYYLAVKRNIESDYIKAQMNLLSQKSQAKKIDTYDNNYYTYDSI